jgi:hypothetical protein
MEFGMPEFYRERAPAKVTHMELISDPMHKYHGDERGSDVLPHPANYFSIILSYL